MRVFLLLLCTLAVMPPATAQEVRRPNIVFILIDDLGYTDIGPFGSTLYQTPHLDRMAAEGMLFTDAYSASPVCSPTRASIQTGRNPARLNLTNFLKGLRSPEDSPILTAEYADYLPSEEVTLAETLGKAGYATGYVGKWHLSREGAAGTLPEEQGYRINIGGGDFGSPKSYFWPEWEGRPEIEGRFDGEYLTDRLALEAVQFIERHREEPFFLMLAHYAVHIPLVPKPEKVAKYKSLLEKNPPIPGRQDNPYYASLVESMDESVGRVLAALEENGLEDNTLVVFTSDNGGLSVVEGRHTPATTNAPLRGGKGKVYEGGIRVPLLVKYPRAVAPGSRSREPVISDDFFPTILEAAGIDPASAGARGPLDGTSLMPLFRSPADSLGRTALYWHYPHFSNQGGRPGGAVRQGRWKLVEHFETGRLELFDLETDIGEHDDLAQTYPERTREMHRMLQAWREEVGANMPLPNPGYKAPSR